MQNLGSWVDTLERHMITGKQLRMRLVVMVAGSPFGEDFKRDLQSIG